MRCILMVLATIVFRLSYAQPFVDVQDTNLQTVMCNWYPSAMANSCTQIDLSQKSFIDDTLNLYNQNIEDITPLLQLDHVLRLEVGENNIDTITSDFTAMTSLQYLDISLNDFNQIPDFSTLPDGVEELRANNLDGDFFPELASVKNSLIRLELRWNDIQELPDMSIFSQLDQADLQRNRLTFTDIVPLKADPDYDTKYIVFPQQQVYVDLPLGTQVLPKGNTFQMKLMIDVPHEENVYEWYKDGQLIETTEEPIFYIHNITEVDEGEYQAVIRNNLPIFGPTDTLYSGTRVVQIQTNGVDCSSLATMTPSIAHNCSESSILLNDKRPDSLSYELTDISSATSITSSSSEFKDLAIGDYSVSVSSPNGCNITYTTLVAVVVDNDCHHVISPNGDGIGDEFYIQEEGEVTITNQAGAILKTLSAPTYWDGTDNNGQLLNAGYYLLIINGTESMAITLER